MRKIGPKAITFFSILTTLNIALNAFLGKALCQNLGLAPLSLLIIIPVTFFFSNLLTFRIVFSVLKFPIHNIKANTSKDFSFQVLVLYYLIFFNFFVLSYILPMFFSRMLHQMLGTKFGAGSYSAGIILDPSYVEIGENSIIGFDAVLCAHALEGENLSFEKIIVGNHVTIGLRAMIMPGVIIEDHAIIAAGALIPKNTHVKEGEVWAGIPAKRIKNIVPIEESKLIGINYAKMA